MQDLHLGVESFGDRIIPSEAPHSHNLLSPGRQRSGQAEPGEPAPLGRPDAARTVQVHDGKAQVKNGSYLAECVAGYYLFEAESVEAAIDLAARVPAARLGGAVEIRPTEKYW